MRIEATGYPDSKRIVDDAGQLVAMAQQYTSGFWAVHHLGSDQKMCEPCHKTPTAAMRWFQSRHSEDTTQ